MNNNMFRNTRMMCLIIVAAFTIPASAQSAVELSVEVGITPESLVIAEVSPATGQVMLNRISAATDIRQSLIVQRQSADEAAQTMTALASLLHENPGHPEYLLQYQLAEQQLSQAQDQLNQLQTQLFMVAVESIPVNKIQSILAWRSGSGRRVPAEFRALEMTPQEWKAVEIALRAERRALRRNRSLASAHTQRLGEIRMDMAVMAAGYQLEYHLPPMKVVFDQYGS